MRNNPYVVGLPSFERLEMVGSVLIFGNSRLLSICGFDSLKWLFSKYFTPEDFLKDPCFGSNHSMVEGMIIACNSNLRAIKASSAIEEIRGVLHISDNPKLNAIELESLWRVTNGTMIIRNVVEDFAWAGPLPFIKEGCDQSKGFLLHTRGSLKAKLAFKICTSDPLVYILICVGLIVLLVIMFI